MVETSIFNNFQPASQHNTLYKIDISGKLGSEYVPLFDDISRMFLIQFTIQLMFYLSASDRAFMTDEFVMLVLYVILGIALYWLVFRNVVKFV